MAILNGGINMKRLGKYTGNIYDENFDTSKINECCLLIKDEDAENKEYIDNKEVALYRIYFNIAAYYYHRAIQLMDIWHYDYYPLQSRHVHLYLIHRYMKGLVFQH